jgi:hypothetical protein
MARGSGLRWLAAGAGAIALALPHAAAAASPGAHLALVAPAAGPYDPSPAGKSGTWCVLDSQRKLKIPANTDLPHWSSPYIGHTGSFNGDGGDAGGLSKSGDMDTEIAMGLHWTFMPVYWSALEPTGPSSYPPEGGPWAALDDFVALAREKHLNILMQGPVLGGNANGPPAWAGQRVQGSAAPVDMQGLATFTTKLVARYMPCGSLARERGWTDGYGVRAWEFENEPYSYGAVHWGNVPDDYAEAFTRVSKAMHAVDPRAVLVSLALNDPDSGGATAFARAVLDKGVQGASPQYIANGVDYAVGPYIDVASFHVYEFLDAVFHTADFEGSKIEPQVAAFRGLVNDPKYLNQDGFRYKPIKELWHTEGGYDYFVYQPAPLGRKENWVIQFLARGFGVGVSRMTIMDAHQASDMIPSVKTFTGLVTDAASIREVTKELKYDPAAVRIFRAMDPQDGHWIYVAWAQNGTVGTSVDLPVRAASDLVSRTGVRTKATVTKGKVTVQLLGLTLFSEPVFLDESPSAESRAQVAKGGGPTKTSAATSTANRQVKQKVTAPGATGGVSLAATGPTSRWAWAALLLVVIAGGTAAVTRRPVLR